MATGAETAPPVFLRKATGLVKGWSRFDAFVYAFLSVNLITLGFFGALSFAPYIPDGQLYPAIIITGIFVTFLVLTYAGLIAIMLRAGGHGVVVHPVAVGTDLRQHPDRSALPAPVRRAGPEDRVHRRGVVGIEHRHLRGVFDHHRP